MSAAHVIDQSIKESRKRGSSALDDTNGERTFAEPDPKRRESGSFIEHSSDSIGGPQPEIVGESGEAKDVDTPSSTLEDKVSSEGEIISPTEETMSQEVEEKDDNNISVPHAAELGSQELEFNEPTQHGQNSELEPASVHVENLDEPNQPSDYYMMRTGPAESRDPTFMPIIATKSTGQRVVLWAKMDTGASTNFISPSLVKQLGREAEKKFAPGSNTIRKFDDTEITINETLSLSFHAGENFATLFEDEEFEIVPEEVHAAKPRPPTTATSENETAGKEDIEEDEKTKHIPHILLGAPFLMRSHALTIDPHFEGRPDPSLEELEKPPTAGERYCFYMGGPTYGRHVSAAAPRTIRPWKR